MDAFEAARLKHAKNLERKIRTSGNASRHLVEEVTPEPQVPVLLAPKEKSRDAVVTVMVNLPSGAMEFTFVKREVLSNVPNHRLTPNEFRKAFVAGLAPLLGRVDEQ